MKKFLLTALSVALVSAAGSAADVTKRLVKITESESGQSGYVTTLGYFPESHANAGLLQSVVDEEESVVFDYSKMASDKIVTITKTGSLPEYGGTYQLNLGDNGYVATATYNCNDGDSSKYAFTYNADGYLTAVVVTEGTDVTNYTLTWADGNVTASEETTGDPADATKCTYTYGNILNPGSLFLIDDMYNVDIEDIEYAAFSGLLGKAPAQLPTKVTETEGTETLEGELLWSTDAEGYPTGYKNEYGSVVFTWEGPAAVESIATDADSTVKAIYSVDGTSRETLGDGINIVRLANGTVQKVIRR